jgi:hypothetical protein
LTCITAPDIGKQGVGNSFYLITYLDLFSSPELLNHFNSIPFLRSRLAVAEAISLKTYNVIFAGKFLKQHCLKNMILTKDNEK